MGKWTFAAVLLLATCGAARAQYYVRPPTNPYFRPQLSPYFTYYYGPGGLGGAYVVPPAFARGGLQGMYPGMMAPPFGGMGGGGMPMTAGGEGAQGEDGRTAGNVTGHPTRFMAYSQYFLNQGSSVAGTAGPASGLPAQQAGAAVFGTGSLPRTDRAGGRPPRGRENTRPGGR